MHECTLCLASTNQEDWPHKDAPQIFVCAHALDQCRVQQKLARIMHVSVRVWFHLTIVIDGQTTLTRLTHVSVPVSFTNTMLDTAILSLHREYTQAWRHSITWQTWGTANANFEISQMFDALGCASDFSSSMSTTSSNCARQKIACICASTVSSITCKAMWWLLSQD